MKGRGGRERVPPVASASILMRLPGHAVRHRLRLQLRLLELRLRLRLLLLLRRLLLRLRLAVQPAVKLDVRYRSGRRIFVGAALLGAAEPGHGQLRRGDQEGRPILPREHRLALRRRGHHDRRWRRPAQQSRRLLVTAVIGTGTTFLTDDVAVRVHVKPASSPPLRYAAIPWNK